MSKYLIDWKIFVVQRLPYVLRKPLHLAWLNSLVAPFVTLHNGFLNAIATYRIKAKITPQVRILRGALNDAFDSVERRITIVDGGQDAYLFIYNVVESKPLYLPKYITGASAASFMVKIPIDIVGQIDVIYSFVKTYKLAGVKFKIVTL
jgi:hypothetical protein